jgi:aminobutyraldehyde dehydrogenase
MSPRLFTRLLIGSDFVDGEGEATAVIDPRRETVIVEIAEASPAQIDAAVAAATGAFEGWGSESPAGRSALLLKLADAIEREAEAFAALEARNCGKPYPAVLRDEIPAIVDCFRFFAGAARTMPGLAAGEYVPGYTSMIRRDPIGVCAQIAPWNYPLMMAAWKIAPAIAAGNTVVLKPSEMTPLTTLKLADVAAGILPPGVLNVVNGRGESVGAPLIRHPKVARSSGRISNSAARRR